MAAVPSPIPYSLGIPVATSSHLKNNTDDCVTLDSQSYWHGRGQPPAAIQNKQEGTFKHSADNAGSVEGVSYVLGDHKIKWTVAWSNAEDQPNKVYTNILKAKEAINWANVKVSLEKNGNQCSAKNTNGYTSDVVLDVTSPTPKMTAKLRPAQ